MALLVSWQKHKEKVSDNIEDQIPTVNSCSASGSPQTSRYKAALLPFCRLYFAFSSGTKNYYFSGLAARKQEKKLLRTVYLHYTDLELPSDASVQWALCDRIRSDRLLGNCSNHRIEILWRLFSRAWLICASSEHGGKTTTYSTDYFCPLFLFYFHL